MASFSPQYSSGYPYLRQVLAPEFASLPPAQIEAVMENMYGAGSAEAYEEYLEGIFGSIGKAISSAASDVGKFARKAAPQVGKFVAKAAPVVANVGMGALQGAMSGSAAGLPGIIAGAAMGGTGAALSKYGKGSARKVGGALTGITNIAGQFSPAGRAGGIVSALAGKGGAGAALGALGGLAGGRGAAGLAGALGKVGGGGGAGAAINTIAGMLGGSGGKGAGAAVNALGSLFGGSGATNQLMSLLQRPETMQALAAMNLGGAGRKTIPVGSAQTPIPTSAITNLIGQLANQASTEAAEFADGAESELAYMTDDTGEFVGDPALDRDRAARVWEMLNEAQAERVLGEIAERLPVESSGESYEESYYESDQTEADFYDALDLVEVYLEDVSEDLQEDILESDGDDLTEDYDSIGSYRYA